MKGMIGLEIHTYLKTNEKLFCRCKVSRERGTQPNTFICPTCSGMPGARPLAPNAEAVRKAVQIVLLLGCTVNSPLTWMRKHYDWPDSPKGYQTTMSGAHATPLGVNGTFSGISISSAHLEEDPASWDPVTGCVDYNRSGLPLVEIVTAPDFSSRDEVVSWLGKLVHALSYLKVVDSNAGIKVDVNVNIPGKTERVEVKNITSLEAIGKAIDYELARQEREGSIRETRRYDEARGITSSMRTKEQEADYRFIPDPDLPNVELSASFVRSLRSALPDLPEVRLRTLIKKYALDAKTAAILTQHIAIADFYEQVAADIDGAFAAPWVTIELLRVLNWNKTTLDKTDIKVEHFVALLALVKKKKITELQAKKILNDFIPRSFDPSNVESKLDDRKELESIIKKIIGSHPKAVADYKNGDTKSLNFLMGEIMKATARRADYTLAKSLLEKLLK